MSHLIHLRASNHRRMPWKNGGGETVEIAVAPQGAALGDFDWRVSMATVASDGPFSIFPGIDRTLSILSGSGMSLAIAGQKPVLLTQASQPLAFAADVPVMATLANGPITDLNVMTRRGRFVHDVERRIVDGDWSGTVASGTTLLLCRDGTLTCSYGGKTGILSENDALQMEARVPVTLALRGLATCYLIRLRQA
jgi:environmental stress-induced protein Ves